MKFIIDENIDINRNRVILHPDNSYGSSNDDTEPWHYQVSLTEWADIILNFNKFTSKCVSCEGFLSEKSKRMRYKSIDIIGFTEAALRFESTEIPDYGIEILIENQLIYFDKDKKMLAFGDVISQEDLIKFGEGQFVKIRDGNIVAVYIVFQKD